jgi:hypothetical protein
VCARVVHKWRWLLSHRTTYLAHHTTQPQQAGAADEFARQELDFIVSKAQWVHYIEVLEATFWWVSMGSAHDMPESLFFFLAGLNIFFPCYTFAGFL